MYYEYAKNELANHEMYVLAYNKLLDHFNNTQFHDSVMRPYFGP